jgi:hypothetical protein
VERIEIEDWRERSLPKAGISVLKTFMQRAAKAAKPVKANPKGPARRRAAWAGQAKRAGSC